MWWALAAAAIPYIVAAGQKKPTRTAPTDVSTPNRDAEINQILAGANDPRSAQWTAASAQVGDQVNRALGRSGMAGSSVGAQLQSGTQGNLAQAWLADQAQRQNAAMQTAMSYDRQKYGVDAANNAAQYNFQDQIYKDRVAANTAQVQGLSNMIGTGMTAYGENRALDQRQQLIDAQKAYLQAQTPVQASYGVPGYAAQDSTADLYANYVPARNGQYASPTGF